MGGHWASSEVYLLVNLFEKPVHNAVRRFSCLTKLSASNAIIAGYCRFWVLLKVSNLERQLLVCRGCLPWQIGGEIFQVCLITIRDNVNGKV